MILFLESWVQDCLDMLQMGLRVSSYPEIVLGTIQMLKILENGSNIRIVALSASLGNAKDLGECRDCVGKTAADLKLLDKGEIIINLVLHWKYTFIIITHAPDIKV